MGAGAGR
jgi:hypothetical protein